jgi:hypothetical protein
VVDPHRSSIRLWPKNWLRGLPPDLRNWLPEGHLAWFVLDVVDQLDLAAFYRAHRNDGHSHPADHLGCCRQAATAA